MTLGVIRTPTFCSLARVAADGSFPPRMLWSVVGVIPAALARASFVGKRFGSSAKIAAWRVSAMPEALTQGLLCAQAIAQDPLSRLGNSDRDLLCDVPSRGKAASPLHSALLKRLRVLFEERGVSIKDGMKAAGSNEQNYNLWQRGASPKLITLETMASKLDMSVLELLGGQRSVFTTPES